MLRMLRIPQATKQGAKRARPSSKEISGVYTYEQRSNVLMTITGSAPVTYDSDLAGNRILENNRVYGYDALNRLATVTESGTQIAAYNYNALNQRVRKITSAGTKIFHYDLNGHLIAETNGTGQTLVEYIYPGDQLLVMIRPTEQVYYYHNDHLGTPRVLTNATGTVVWKARYTPFGAATITVSNVENNIRFPGQYFDIETGKHYNWNRYYDPKTGRYVTPDPIGLNGGINLFNYVGGNPINFIDPSGLFNDGGPGAKYKGHLDFSGKNCFNYSREDKGLTGPTVDPERHFRDLAISERNAIKAIRQCDKYSFQSALHRGQDYFSHRRNGFQWKLGNRKLPCNGAGHLCTWDWPEDEQPDNDMNAWRDAEEWTKRLLRIWNEFCHCKCKAI